LQEYFLFVLAAHYLWFNLVVLDSMAVLPVCHRNSDYSIDCYVYYWCNW